MTAAYLNGLRVQFNASRFVRATNDAGVFTLPFASVGAGAVAHSVARPGLVVCSFHGGSYEA